MPAERGIGNLGFRPRAITPKWGQVTSRPDEGICNRDARYDPKGWTMRPEFKVAVKVDLVMLALILIWLTH